MPLCEGDHFGGDIPLAQGERQLQGVFIEKTKPLAADALLLDPERVKHEQRRCIGPGPQRRVVGAQGFLVHPENRSLQGHWSVGRSQRLGRARAAFPPPLP